MIYCVRYSDYSLDVALVQFVMHCCARQQFGYQIRIRVRCWSAVFQIAAAHFRNRAGNSHRAGAIGDSPGEGVDVGGFVRAVQTTSVIGAAFRVVVSDVFGVFFG